MGVVYSASELETGGDVAIKALNLKAFTTANLRRFRREAQMASSVRNRFVCQVSYLGVEQGAPFIVMERLRGETLRRRLTETGPMSPTDAVTVMIQMLEGLSAAHAGGVLHRDIKPSNIFITTPRGAAPSIKIIDFGLAKLLPVAATTPKLESLAEEYSAITTTGMIPGTPFYLAPEQVAGARDLDERVDVWAAGLTFFEMLIGRRAYDAATHSALATSILRRSVPLASGIRPDVPAVLDDVLRIALAKERSERFPSAAAFRAALVEAWARVRAEGVARGQRLTAQVEAPPLTSLDEVDDVGGADATEIDVEVSFDSDGC
jgi:serine/threonine protein kinase